ncbi:hypothetical protein BV25DRAFT_1990572 [Artomyces pyxidatus]|uniref:Uncharacterized protein n=1 Tax=Artomyces pyxidatus TaxID=48021 RepID=A0ACB8T520_9AGAM|nr:hypothetical protein BV25DRAFT_1990572 [Artomyces pyxidatus]
MLITLKNVFSQRPASPSYDPLPVERSVSHPPSTRPRRSRTIRAAFQSSLESLRSTPAPPYSRSEPRAVPSAQSVIDMLYPAHNAYDGPDLRHHGEFAAAARTPSPRTPSPLSAADGDRPPVVVTSRGAVRAPILLSDVPVPVVPRFEDAPPPPYTPRLADPAPDMDAPVPHFAHAPYDPRSEYAAPPARRGFFA